MKTNCFLLALMLFLCIGTISAKKITIIRSGSDDGIKFDRVQERHGFFESKLSCIAPGNITCGWSVEPTIGGYLSSEIENYVHSRISSGDLSGSVSYNNSVFVTWEKHPLTGDLTILMDDGE